MKIKLAYGKKGLTVELPDTWNITLLEPDYEPGLPDPRQALRAALRRPSGCPPLGELLRAGDKIGIVFSDMTRPTPNHILIPVLLQELARVPRENITLFNSLGTHRSNSEAELRRILGDPVVDGYRIVQNDAFRSETQACLGRTGRGHELWLNRELLACDFKILTGFIEPHFFAGFSGGGKAVLPGMAGLQTVLGNHDAGMIDHPRAMWGVTEGNPIWEESHEAAAGIQHRPDGSQGLFLLNVALNRDQEITGVFAGDLDLAHRRGCDFVRARAMKPVSEPFAIVVTTNSGYPLDLNLYQTVKGMSAAAQVVQSGGAILAVSECSEGIPEHGLYGKLLREAETPQQVLERIRQPGFLAQDQWEAHVQALVQLKADVYLYSDGLSDSQIRGALLRPCRDIPALLDRLRQRFGASARMAVLPQGPQTVGFVQGSRSGGR